MRKKNATQSHRISYYSGWRRRLERKSHFYFWPLWRWVHGVHVNLTTTIYWLQTFSGHAEKVFIVALQRQCHEGDLVWEGKAAYLLRLRAGAMPAEQPHLTSRLGLTAHSQGREGYTRRGVPSASREGGKLRWAAGSKGLCAVCSTCSLLGHDLGTCCGLLAVVVTKD